MFYGFTSAIRHLQTTTMNLVKRIRSLLFCEDDSFPFVLVPPEKATPGAKFTTIAAAQKTKTTRIGLSVKPSTKHTVKYNDIKADLFMIETRPRSLSDA